MHFQSERDGIMGKYEKKDAWTFSIRLCFLLASSGKIHKPKFIQAVP